MQMAFVVAFEEIPQRELREPKVLDMPRRSVGRWLVAFEEIPQRELREPMRNSLAAFTTSAKSTCVELHSKKSHKGNWEPSVYHYCLALSSSIKLHSKKSHKGNWEPKLIRNSALSPSVPGVAFEEIPQRELRGQPGPEGKMDEYVGCIRRNPTKGIESLPLKSQSAIEPWIHGCIRRNPTKGIESKPFN